MNYQRAKELKEARFPQDNPRFIRGHYTSNADRTYGAERVYFPTLEELIEACGEEFMLTNECGKWEAWSNVGGRLRGVRMGEGGAVHEIEGDTHTEAVAKLWLALNKKAPPTV